MITMGENKMRDNRYYREGDCEPAGLVLMHAHGAWERLELSHAVPFIGPCFCTSSDGQVGKPRLTCHTGWPREPRWAAGRLDRSSVFWIDEPFPPYSRNVLILSALDGLSSPSPGPPPPSDPTRSLVPPVISK